MTPAPTGELPAVTEPRPATRRPIPDPFPHDDTPTAALDALATGPTLSEIIRSMVALHPDHVVHVDLSFRVEPK